MKYELCKKCGASHAKNSKHKPLMAEGKAWCGHCGYKLSKAGK